MNKGIYYAALTFALGTIQFLRADNENFTYGELSGRDFSNQSLKNSTWTHADLSNASFAGAFAGANLDGANFEDASLNGTDFTDAIITNMYWGASFTRNQLYSTASYKNKDLSGLKLEYYKFNNNLDLSGQNLNGASFRNCTLGMVDFTDAWINNVNFYSAKSFSGEKLYSTASYKNKDLSGIDFRFVDVKNWDFSGQNLSGVNFYSGDFTGADFLLERFYGGRFYGFNNNEYGFQRQQSHLRPAKIHGELQEQGFERRKLFVGGLGGFRLFGPDNKQCVFWQCKESHSKPDCKHCKLQK